MSTASTTAPSPLQQARDAVDVLHAVVADLQAGELGFVDAEALAEVFASGTRCCQTGTTITAGRVAEGTAFRRHGHKTAVDWLAHLSKCSRAHADRTLETATHLVDQPHIDQAMRAGALNADQANLVSAASVADPAAEAELVSKAGRESLGGLWAHCKQVTAAARGDDVDRNARHRRNRQGRSWFDEEGAHHFENANTGAAGVITEAALNPFRELAFRAAKARGAKLSQAQLDADAFEMMCAASIGVTPTCILPDFDTDAATDINSEPRAESGAETTEPTDLFATAERFEADDIDDATVDGPPTDLDTDPSVDQSGEAHPEPDDQPERDPDPPPVDLSPTATVIPWEPTAGGVKLPNGRRIDVTVLVDHTAFTRGHTIAGETCEIAGLGPVPVAAVRDLIATGDPFYAALIKRGQDLVTGVHLGRQARAVQRTAVVAKDHGTCAVAGCTNTICEVDHNDDWAHTHTTEFTNLRLLCTQTHHPMKTAGGTLWYDTNGDLHITPPPGWGQQQQPAA